MSKQPFQQPALIEQQRHSSLEQLTISARRQRSPGATLEIMPVCLAIIILAIGALACRFIETDETDFPSTSGRVVIRTQLPTLTATPLAQLSVEAGSTPAATPLAVESVDTVSAPAPSAIQTETTPSPAGATIPLEPTAVPSPTTTPTLDEKARQANKSVSGLTLLPGDSAGWSFTGIRAQIDPDGAGLLVYGRAVNETDRVQHLKSIQGTFYDSQDKVIADEAHTFDYLPIDIIRPGEEVPFQLTVIGIAEAASFKLRVETEASDQHFRQDFQFANLNQSSEGEEYCLEGEFQNPGEPLAESLLIVATAYDNQDQVINFGEYETYQFGLSDASFNFGLCMRVINQDVARHELQAWGK